MSTVEARFLGFKYNNWLKSIFYLMHAPTTVGLVVDPFPIPPKPECHLCVQDYPLLYCRLQDFPLDQHLFSEEENIVTIHQTTIQTEERRNL